MAGDVTGMHAETPAPWRSRHQSLLGRPDLAQQVLPLAYSRADLRFLCFERWADGPADRVLPSRWRDQPHRAGFVAGREDPATRATGRLRIRHRGVSPSGRG